MTLGVTHLVVNGIVLVHSDRVTSAKAALGEAIQHARTDAGLSQTDLAEQICIDQPRLSRYIRGVDLVPYDLLPLIDAACGKPKGHVLRLAGLVDEGVDVVAAIQLDAKLGPDEREAMLLLYSTFLKLSER